MRLGLVADVHNHGAHLARALAVFRGRGVEQVVSLGDACDPFSRAAGADVVASLLDGCAAVGVWGNHDFTLCRDVPAGVRDRYPPAVLDVMARMQSRLVLEGCHFSHREASVDPHDVAQLWDADEGPLDLMALAGRAFGAVGYRWQFVGHYHRWWATTPDGVVDWSGVGRLWFVPGRRYFVVVAPVFDGWCGVLDTEEGSFEPLRCDPFKPNAAPDRARL
jgi:predicted phosphodiesterase